MCTLRKTSKSSREDEEKDFENVFVAQQNFDFDNIVYDVVLCIVYYALIQHENHVWTVQKKKNTPGVDVKILMRASTFRIYSFGNGSRWCAIIVDIVGGEGNGMEKRRE